MSSNLRWQLDDILINHQTFSLQPNYRSPDALNLHPIDITCIQLGSKNKCSDYNTFYRSILKNNNNVLRFFDINHLHVTLNTQVLKDMYARMFSRYDAIQWSEVRHFYRGMFDYLLATTLLAFGIKAHFDAPTGYVLSLFNRYGFNETVMLPPEMAELFKRLHICYGPDSSTPYVGMKLAPSDCLVPNPNGFDLNELFKRGNMCEVVLSNCLDTLWSSSYIRAERASALNDLTPVVISDIVRTVTTKHCSANVVDLLISKRYGLQNNICIRVALLRSPYEDLQPEAK